SLTNMFMCSFNSLQLFIVYYFSRSIDNINFSRSILPGKCTSAMYQSYQSKIPNNLFVGYLFS
ncbi:MAG: hypothetical protein ACTHM5_02335, partial [Ginsengibacter sp.]